ncbi:hypothetical protein STEG23_016468 [Scotinomys teguina]
MHEEAVTNKGPGQLPQKDSGAMSHSCWSGSWRGALIFDKDAKTVKWKKESIFNKWCWHYWMATCRRLQTDPYLSPCTKLKSKWIKDLNINPVSLNLIEEKVGSTIEHIGTGDHFLNITPTTQKLSATINQWDYMKLRSFCKAKDTITKTKRQPTEWEKIFTNPTSDRGLISRIYKELKKHDIKTPDSPIEKWPIEILHPVTDGSRCRDPQPSTTSSSRNLSEESEEEFYEQGHQDHDSEAFSDNQANLLGTQEL